MAVLCPIALFGAAAVFEIGGAWLVWQGVREHKGWARGRRWLPARPFSDGRWVISVVDVTAVSPPGIAHGRQPFALPATT